MKKRILSIISAILVLVCTLASCGHDHIFNQQNKEVITPATCTTGGTEKESCECGESRIVNTSSKGHSFKEGFCTECRYVSDAKNALAYIIKTEGTEFTDTPGTYFYPKEDFVDGTHRTFISYDSNKKEYTFTYTTTDIILYISFTPGETKADIMMLVSLSDQTYLSTGYITPYNFDINYSTVYSFSTYAPSYLTSNMKSIMETSTKIALIYVSEILNLTNADITMRDLGFYDFEET